jgi:pSer/pThr/pTyr-binding forkhead associated (FHA) protein
VTYDAPASPRPQSGGELKRVMDAERAGEPFVAYRDATGAYHLASLTTDAPLTIGRRPTNQIVIDWDPQVSRAHAALECIGGEWTIADDGLSRNGTFVNNARIAGRLRLSDGDVVRCGGTSLLFRAPVEGSMTLTAPPSAPAPVDALTDAQRRVLIALCRPYKQRGAFATPATNQQIADELFLSVDAVKTHLRILFQVFGIQDLPRNEKRARLVDLALTWGVVTDRDL